MPPSTLSAGMAHLLVISVRSANERLVWMCEIAWNIGQRCLLFCKLSANLDRAIPFNFLGETGRNARDDCPGQNPRSSEQQGSDEPTRAKIARDVTRKLAMILHETIEWKTEVQSIWTGV